MFKEAESLVQKLVCSNPGLSGFKTHALHHQAPGNRLTALYGPPSVSVPSPTQADGFWSECKAQPSGKASGALASGLAAVAQKTFVYHTPFK